MQQLSKIRRVIVLPGDCEDGKNFAAKMLEKWAAHAKIPFISTTHVNEEIKATLARMDHFAVAVVGFPKTPAENNDLTRFLEEANLVGSCCMIECVDFDGIRENTLWHAHRVEIVREWQLNERYTSVTYNPAAEKNVVEITNLLAKGLAPD